MKELCFALAGLALAAGLAASPRSCLPSGSTVTVEEMVRRLEQGGIKYVFIGESHASVPPKRLAVELTNRLVERGHDVGLYVEGFRTDCASADDTCRSLARLFNEGAFSTLLAESRAPVRPLDPPERDRRAARMAATIAGGTEAIRVVLVGSTHVIHAQDPNAELWIFGGGMRYPDPGDLVEAFPSGDSVTIVLEDGDAQALRADGCKADYALVAPATTRNAPAPPFDGGGLEVRVERSTSRSTRSP